VPLKETLRTDLANIIRNLDWSVLLNIILSIVPSLICITIHETAHGFVAYKLGDPTAKNAGRLSLNPLKHIDPFGLVMMAIFHFGWAKPVPIDMRWFKNPKRGMALSAAAGPISNVMLACIFLIIYGALYPFLYNSAFGGVVLQMVYITAYISIALAIFNIIPIPPLDGSKVLYSFLSDRTYLKLMRYERYGMIALIVLVFVSSRTGIFGDPLGTAAGFIFDKLFFFAELSFKLFSKIV